MTATSGEVDDIEEKFLRFRQPGMLCHHDLTSGVTVRVALGCAGIRRVHVPWDAR